MLKDTLNINSVLVSFESVLKIEYKEKDARHIIDNSIKSLESAYAVELNKDIFELQAENQLIGDAISTLLTQIVECCKTLSLYISICMFNRSIGISLADVNYLGFAREQLVQGLKYLQDKDLYEKRKAIIDPLTSVLSNLEMCTVKRLVAIMLILEKLGVSEGVSIIAQYLYLGGLVA